MSDRVQGIGWCVVFNNVISTRSFFPCSVVQLHKFLLKNEPQSTLFYKIFSVVLFLNSYVSNGILFFFMWHCSFQRRGNRHLNCLIFLLELFGPPFFTVFLDSNTLIHSFWSFSWTFSFCFFKDFFFLMWTNFKVFIKLVTILLLLFMFWVFGHKTCHFWFRSCLGNGNPLQYSCLENLMGRTAW